MKHAAVILAAGQSTRFGQPKQLLQWQGETLLQRACRIARESGHDPILVVLADPAPDFGPLPAEVIVLSNPRHQQGMGTSLALAAQYLQSTTAETLTVILPDQPAITAELLERLRESLSSFNHSIALCQCDGHQGPPSCFQRVHFPALAQLDGDEGGKALVRAHRDEVAFLSAPEAFWDVDTPEVWEKFRQ